MANVFGTDLVSFELLLHQLPGAEGPDYGYGEEHGVDAVEHASVAGQDGAGVFDSRSSFYEGFDQVAELGGEIDDRRERDYGPERRLLVTEHSATRVDQADAE